MPYCLRCIPFSCGGSTGLISINWSTSNNLSLIDPDCGPGSPSEKELLGPTTGTVSINAYAFSAGSDRWAGSRCQGSAQASQTVIMKYDANTDKHYLIPSKNHSAQITGDVGNLATIETVCTTTSVDSKIVSNTTITTQLETQLGKNFKYNGEPLAVEIPFLGSYEVFGQRSFLTNISLSVDFPSQPATVTYTFQFILHCDSGGPSLT